MRLSEIFNIRFLFFFSFSSVCVQSEQIHCTSSPEKLLSQIQCKIKLIFFFPNKFEFIWSKWQSFIFYPWEGRQCLFSRSSNICFSVITPSMKSETERERERKREEEEKKASMIKLRIVRCVKHRHIHKNIFFLFFSSSSSFDDDAD